MSENGSTTGMLAIVFVNEMKEKRVEILCLLGRLRFLGIILSTIAFMNA